MEKQAAPPRNQHTGTAAVEMEKQARPPTVLRPLTPLEVKEGPMADYDANVQKRIDERWRELFEPYSYPPPSVGTVIVEFRIRHDGSVRECRVTKNDVGEWGELCREAVEKAAPFGEWPPEMRRLIGLNPREARYTFYFSRTGTAVIEMEKPATPPPKPRTLSEARQLSGWRKSNTLALAQSPGPIADYDANLRKRIDRRWRQLIAKSSYPPRAGKVVVEFGLIIDGSVAGCRVTKNDVGEWGKLCREAIEQAAPFGPWPAEMRRLFGSDHRDIRFTFDYSVGDAAIP